MSLSINQTEILKAIQARIIRGDIRDIANDTEFTREYVGSVLNPNSDIYNTEIVDAAVRIIEARELKLESQLQKLTGV